jgi:hypothetical protein
MFVCYEDFFVCYVSRPNKFVYIFSPFFQKKTIYALKFKQTFKNMEDCIKILVKKDQADTKLSKPFK